MDEMKACPREPNEAMIDAGEEFYPCARGTESRRSSPNPEDIWRVMWDALRTSEIANAGTDERVEIIARTLAEGLWAEARKHHNLQPDYMPDSRTDFIAKARERLAALSASKDVDLTRELQAHKDALAQARAEIAELRGDAGPPAQSDWFTGKEDCDGEPLATLPAALLREVAEHVRHAPDCAHGGRGDAHCDCGAVDYLNRLAALNPPQPVGEEGLVKRIEYILDPSASASERLARRAHLTNHDLRRCIEALSQAADLARLKEQVAKARETLRAWQDAGQVLREKARAFLNAADSGYVPVEVDRALRTALGQISPSDGEAGLTYASEQAHTILQEISAPIAGEGSDHAD